MRCKGGVQTGPPLWTTEGQMSTQQVWILAIRYDNGFFSDFTLDDPVGAHHWLAEPERDDDIVPGRIGGLGNVSWRWIRLGMGVGMNDTYEF